MAGRMAFSYTELLMFALAGMRYSAFCDIQMILKIRHDVIDDTFISTPIVFVYLDKIFMRM